MQTMTKSLRHLRFKAFVGQRAQQLVLTFLLVSVFCSNAVCQTSKEKDMEAGWSLLHQIDNTKDPNGGVSLARKAMPYFVKAEDWASYVLCFSYISSAYYYTEEYDSCLYYAVMAKTMAETHLKDTSSSYLVALNNLGAIYDLFGNSEGALKLYQKSIEIQKKTGRNPNDFLIDLENKGFSFFAIGDYDEAIANFQNIRKILSDSIADRQPDLARIYLQIGKCYRAKNLLEAAKSNFRKSLAAQQTLPRLKYYDQVRWFAYLDLADIFIETNQTDSALQCLNLAVGIDARHNLLEGYRTWASRADS